MVQFPAGARDFCFLDSVQGPSSVLSSEYKGLFIPGVKHETDLSPFNVEVKHG
jgi:hypothetical protein